MMAPNPSVPKAAPVVTELTVTIFKSFETASVACEEWDQLVLEVSGDLYVTYHWCRLWWKHYGEDRQLRLFVFRAGKRLVGLAPMFIERVRLGPVSLRIAKRVGADFALTAFALPLATDYVEAAYHKVITKLIDSEKCDAVWFGFLPANDSTLGGLRDACRSLQEVVIVVRDAPAGLHTLFRLPDSFEVYLAGLHRQQRQSYRRHVKLLNKNFEVGSDVVRDPLQAQSSFSHFKFMHNLQWQAEGKLGHFGDWPRSELFNTDLVNELSRLDRFRMVRLFANGKVVSCLYAFVFGNCCYWRLPARAAERELDRFRLGRLGLMELIKAMINEGVCRIEAGLGHYDYKLQLGGEELELRTVLIATSRRGVSGRVRFFLKLSDLLHLVYYRGWFLRLAPRLGLMWPLWRTWIRCRL